MRNIVVHACTVLVHACVYVLVMTQKPFSLGTSLYKELS